MRFSDVIWQRFAEADFKEEEHPRDSDGKFATTNGRGSKKSPQQLRQTPLDDDRAQTAASRGRQLLREGVRPDKAVMEAARLAQGYVDTNLGAKRSRVHISTGFVKEILRNFHPETIRTHAYSPLTNEERKRIAEKLITAIGSLHRLIRSGMRHRWEDPAGQHEGEKVMTISGSCVQEDEERIRCTLDLLKRDETEQVRAHLLNVEGTRTFEGKMKALKNPRRKGGDSAECFDLYELVGLRLI